MPSGFAAERARRDRLALATLTVAVLVGGCGGGPLPDFGGAPPPACEPTSPVDPEVDARLPALDGPPRILDTFDRYGVGRVLEGGWIGPWQVRFDGYGAVETGDGALTLRPREASSPDATHAALVLGPEMAPPFRMELAFRTRTQLRRTSPANPWEVAWVVWHYEDRDHFYYFIPKPNGWELGKRDPAYPGGQRMLATGERPRFPPGRDVRLAVTVGAGGTVTVATPECTVARVRDSLLPYDHGRIGLYTEDAEVTLEAVVVR